MGYAAFESIKFLCYYSSCCLSTLIALFSLPSINIVLNVTFILLSRSLQFVVIIALFIILRASGLIVAAPPKCEQMA